MSAIGLVTSTSFASDHIDGAVTTGHRVGDLTDLYAFPTPNKPGSLSIVLDTYPVVLDTGHFSEKVGYNIYLRRAMVRPSGQQVGFDTSDEVMISCTFVTPDDTAGHVATCKTSNGLMASTKYNVVQGQREGDDFRLFAGMRNDPFFFDANFATTLANKGRFPLLSLGNIMDGINCLSIIMDIDVSKLFSGTPPSLIALAAQSVTDNGTRQLDRVGRPEITNVSLVAQNEPDLRDQYNLDRPFQVNPANQSQYRERLAKNIAFYDNVDGSKQWSDQNRENLATILADDFLVVDISKPCSGVGFLEIEKSILQGKTHRTCGGRKPADGIMDILFTLYIGGFNGPLVTDGVTAFKDGDFVVKNEFPYLAQPNFLPWAVAKVHTVLFLKGLVDFFKGIFH